MRFIRSRLGLIVWASLWLIVALVPSWRSRASRVGFEVLNLHSPSYALSPEMENEAARRFPTEAAALVAPLHGVISGPTNSPFPLKSPRLEDEYFARYDALEKRFPSANFVRIQRLRDTMKGPMGIDEGLPPARLRSYKTEWMPPWLSKEQLERALQTAQEGARHEPDNAFFPWTECVLNFSLKRDDKAIRALDAAAKCSRFDDDITGVSRRRIGLLRRLKRSNFEDEISEQASILIPHLSPMRIAARAITGRMRLAREQGDEARAFELAGTLQRAGAAMTRTDGAIVTKLVGQAICVMAWSTITENEPNRPQAPWGVIDGPLPPEYFVQREEYNRAKAARFAAYARAHGRGDLASEAEEIVSSFDGDRMAAIVQSPTVDTIWTRFVQVERFQWLGNSLLLFNVLAVVLWVAARLFTLGKAVLTPEQTRTAQLSALWSAGVGAVLIGVVAARSPNILSLGDLLETPSSPSALTPLFDNFEIALACAWLVPIIGAMLWNWLKGFNWRFSLKTSQERKGALIFGIAGLFSFLVLVGSLSAGQEANPVLRQVFPLVQTLLVVGVFVGSGLCVWWTRSPNRPAVLCFTGAFCLGCMAQLLVGASGYLPYYSPVAGAGAVFFALMGTILSWRGWLPSWRGTGNFIRELAARTGIAAATLALFCTLGYVGIALWIIPVDHNAEILLNRQLQIGEVAVLRQQMQEQK